MPRILIADDDDDILLVLKLILEDKGYNVLIQHDAKNLLALIEDYKPNLVLLDVILNGADGREICKQLKQEHSMPVVLFSAMSQLEKHSKASNADGYIEKPFDINEFIFAISSFLPCVNAGCVN